MTWTYNEQLLELTASNIDPNCSRALAISVAFISPYP